MSTSNTVPATEIPSPDDPRPNAAFWGWLRQHQLRVQRCTNCGVTHTPAAEICRGCYGQDFEWVAIPAVGRIFSWTRVWQPARDELVGHTPYLVVMVEIDNHPDKPRFVGNLGGEALQAVAIGDAVRGHFDDRPEGTLLNWVRAETQ